MAVEGGTVSHYYILVIRKFIDFMSLLRHSMWFSLSFKQFPSAEFGICNIVLHTADKNRRRVELSSNQSINQSINQLYLNTVNGSASWFSDMPCDNYNL